MRTHITIGLVALMLGACASNEHLTPQQQQKRNQDLQTRAEYRMIQGAGASQIR